MTDNELIAAAYDAGVDEEYARLESNVLFEAEYAIVSELMQKYIPEGSVVIDIGSGPGRYAELFLNRNCKVGLIDLSIKSLNAFNHRINKSYKENILFTKVACATDLSFVNEEVADAVFIMGPLYHLASFEKRNKAISEAKRVLKKNGLLFAIFLSTFDSNPNNFNNYQVNNNPVIDDQITTVDFCGFKIPQYKCLPKTALNFIEPNGFETVLIQNLEGVGQNYSLNDLKKIQTAEQKKLFFNEVCLRGQREEMIGFADQFLYIGRKNIIHN